MEGIIKFSRSLSGHFKQTISTSFLPHKWGLDLRVLVSRRHQAIWWCLFSLLALFIMLWILLYPLGSLMVHALLFLDWGHLEPFLSSPFLLRLLHCNLGHLTHIYGCVLYSNCLSKAGTVLIELEQNYLLIFLNPLLWKTNSTVNIYTLTTNIWPFRSAGIFKVFYSSGIGFYHLFCFSR